MAMFDCPHCGDTHHVNDFCATGPMSLAASPPAREEAPALNRGRLPICEDCDGSGAEDEEAACLICNGTGELGRDANGREAPAEGAGDDLMKEVMWAMRSYAEVIATGDEEKWARISAIIAALRNRTSEPEAGENSQNDYSPRKTLTDPAPTTADKLRVAVEALEKARDHYDLLVRLANGGAVYEVEKVSRKRIRRKLSEVIAYEADAGSKHTRQALSALNEQPQ